MKQNKENIILITIKCNTLIIPLLQVLRIYMLGSLHGQTGPLPCRSAWYLFNLI